MGYSENEFFHTLPTAIGEYQFTREGRLVTITHPDKDHLVELNVIPAPDRVIGMMRIERVDVSFSFKRFSVTERDAFMAQFDRSFQRGGG